MRHIMALFEEYQSKENAKHVLRALKENARQGFWNGSLPPIGYRVVAAEQRGAKTRKKLEIDPLRADTVRLIYRLALEGDGDRYYTCSTKVRQEDTGCTGRSVPMDKLDNLVAEHIEHRLLAPEPLEEVLASVLDRRQERAERMKLPCCNYSV
jgi:hypothetical protein